MSKKKIDKPVIEPWDDFNEIDLSKKRYFTDEHLAKLRLSQSELIRRFKKVHGNKYDYSKVNYTIMREDVCIICPKHGEFFKSPYAHMRGQGCPECTKERSRRYTPEQILKMFKKVHGNRYDYSKSKITTLNAKILIICKKHGEFFKTPTYHLQGYGHPKDGYQNVKIKMKKNWSDPEIRKKRTQGIRKSWEERTRVSKKDRDKMVSLRKKKYSYKEIGKELELTASKVISAFKRYNLKELVPIDQVYKKWTPERRINHLKKFTKTLPTQSLRSTRKSNSIWNENTDTTLLNLVSKGISMTDIAKEMKLTKGQVVGRYNRLKK